MTGGFAATGTVTLTGPSPAGGAVVDLWSANPAIVAVPASITIPAGTTTGTFTANTTAVPYDLYMYIIAARGTMRRNAILIVSPPSSLGLYNLSLNPIQINGGNPTTGTVTLTGNAPAGGAVVALTSAEPGVAAMPASVTVPEGATSATFTINTTVVGTTHWPSIAASFHGVALTETLTVMPPAGPTPTPTRTATATPTATRTPPPGATPTASPAAGVTLTALTLNPTTVNGRDPSTGRVTLSGPAPAGGAKVTLTSSNTAAATVPGSVTIPAGATSATFTISTVRVQANTTVTISGTYSGLTRSAPLTIRR